MKTLRLINTLGLAAIAMLATTSCESGNQEFDYDGQTSVYYSKPAIVRTVELGEDREVDLTEDNQHYINIMAFCGGGYTNGNDVTVDYVIDPTLVEGKSMVYNDKERAMTVMPQEYYTVENANQFVISKGNLTGGPRIHLTDAFFADPKSLDVNYVIPVRLTKAVGVDKILDDQNYTVCAVKFVNPWHATYLRRGVDEITYADGTSTKAVRHTQYMEKGEVINITSSGLKQSKMVLAVKGTDGKAHNVTLLLNFDDDNNCTITTADQGAEASGTGKFVKACENMGGTKRNALYLNYNVKVDGVASLATTDTMVVRNRGIVGEYFTIK